MIINVVIFVLQNVIGDSFTNIMGLTFSSLFEGKIWELVTYQFIHGSFSHLFWNMLLLYIAAPFVEQAWGEKRFAQLYVSAGALAGIAQVFLVPNSFVLGASGSIMGVFTVFALFNPNREMMLIFPPIPVKVKYIFLFYVITDLMGTSSSASGVAHFAHLGGALMGFVFFKMYGNAQQYGNSRSKSSGFSDSMSSVFNNLKHKVQNSSNPNMTYTSNHSAGDPNKLRHYRKVVDELLDKINTVGYLKLSDDERRRLEEASDYLKKYDSH